MALLFTAAIQVPTWHFSQSVAGICWGTMTVSSSVPEEVEGQLLRARSVIERHLPSTLQAIHLYGSAVEGGLQPESDLDLLVTVSSPPDEPLRQALLRELLMVSAPASLQALKVTVIAHSEVVPQIAYRQNTGEIRLASMFQFWIQRRDMTERYGYGYRFLVDDPALLAPLHASA